MIGAGRATLEGVIAADCLFANAGGRICKKQHIGEWLPIRLPSRWAVKRSHLSIAGALGALVAEFQQQVFLFLPLR